MSEKTANEMPMIVETDLPVNPAEVPANTQVVFRPNQLEEKYLGHSRIGITKKVYRPAAEKKARKLAKKNRKMNRRRNSGR